MRPRGVWTENAERMDINKVVAFLRSQKLFIAYHDHNKYDATQSWPEDWCWKDGDVRP